MKNLVLFLLMIFITSCATYRMEVPNRTVTPICPPEISKKQCEEETQTAGGRGR